MERSTPRDRRAARKLRRRIQQCAAAGMAAALAVGSIAASHDASSPAGPGVVGGGSSASAATSDSGSVLPLGDLTAIPPVGAYGRTPLHVDPIHARFVSGTWDLPAPGLGMNTAAGRRVTWEPLAPAEEGVWRSPALAGGYAVAVVTSDRPRVLLLEATGHAMVYVNGQPRAGDPYATGRTVCPVALTEGANELVFHVAAGELKARLIEPPQELFLDLRDAVFPDLAAGQTGPVFASALLVNATERTVSGGELTTSRAGGQSITSKTPSLPPLGVARLVVPVDGKLTAEAAAAGSVRVQVDVTLPATDGGSRRVADSKALDLAVVQPGDLQTRTFLSRVDGSVQAYAVLPAAQRSSASAGDSPPPAAAAPGVLLALHTSGTAPEQMLLGVEPLEGAHIVAPTGRRESGFDWQDWSRHDALEALDEFCSREPTDPARTWVAGAADGGHGALRMAALYPDRFAAAATVDGWLDYFSYGASMPPWTDTDDVQVLMASCAADQQLAPLLGNLAGVGLVVHCDAAAPADLLGQSQMLRAALSEFHNDFAYRVAYREDSRAASGALDAAVTQQLLARRLPDLASVNRVEFATPDVGVSSSCHWVALLAPRHPGEVSRVSALCDDANRVLHMATENVAGLQVELTRLSPGEPVSVAIDGQSLGPLPWPTGREKSLRFARRQEGWQFIDRLPAQWKRPERFGGFRAAWDRRVALVYGTGGTAEENAWALAKARFDAEQFLVRAGGSALVVADVDFDAQRDPDRNIVLYGNADSNSQWRDLLTDSPVQTRKGQVIVGGRPESGDDLACLFVRPRPGSPTALVAVVSGSGLPGMRATDRLPLFVSGVRMPDLLLFGADAVGRGASEVRAVGWFGLDWSVAGGEFAWREAAL